MTNSTRIVLTSLATGEKHELRKDATVGRGAHCDLWLTRATGSRTHAKIAFDGGAVWVEDLGSVHGTFVNEVRVQGRTQIRPGDRLHFGEERFDVTAPPTTLVLWRDGRSLPTDAKIPANPAPVPDPAPAPRDAVLIESETAALKAPAQVTAAPAASESAKPEAPPAPVLNARRPGAWVDSGQRPKVVETHNITAEDMRRHLASRRAVTPAETDVEGPHLLIVTGERAQVAVPLLAKEESPSEWTIGRGGDLDVIIPDLGVSALHARIVSDGKRWKLVDQLSANGTFVNNKRSNVSYLGDNDHLRFGPIECVFLLRGGVAGGKRGWRWLGYALGFALVLGALAAGYRWLQP